MRLTSKHRIEEENERREIWGLVKGRIFSTGDVQREYWEIWRTGSKLGLGRGWVLRKI